MVIEANNVNFEMLRDVCTLINGDLLTDTKVAVRYVLKAVAVEGDLNVGAKVIIKIVLMAVEIATKKIKLI